MINKATTVQAYCSLRILLREDIRLGHIQRTFHRDERKYNENGDFYVRELASEKNSVKYGLFRFLG